MQLQESGERRPIAMKVIKGRKSGSTFKSHRWGTEQKIMQVFEHPNLVQVYFYLHNIIFA